MSQTSKTKALILLLAIFLAGGALGWLAHEQIIKEGRGRTRGVDPLVARFTKELDLNDGQQDSVRAILTRRQRETRALWQELHPRYEVIRARAKAEIEAQLTADQKVRFEALDAQMEKEREQARADTARGRRP